MHKNPFIAHFVSLLLLVLVAEISNVSAISIATVQKPFKSGWEQRGEQRWRDLKWGFATSAYQIEGAWDQDGKGQNVWDNFTRRDPSPIDDKSNGDIACDSYHNFKEDVKLMSELGVQIYRFSISMSRILPNGTKDFVNPIGIAYYNDLINELISHKIEPLVTLHHFDLPQVLEDRGGFLQEDAIVQPFVDYAEIVFREFGDRVKRWITFNEPYVTCVFGYETGLFAPGIMEKDPAKGALACGHNLLKAHGAIYRLYESQFKKEQDGVIGISMFAQWFESYNFMEEENAVNGIDKKKMNLDGAERARQEVMGWFLEPVIRGTYPKALEEIYGKNKVPKIDSKLSKLLKGSVDFIGLNHYTTFRIINGTWHPESSKMEFYSDPSAPESGSKWLRVEPHGFRRLLRWIQDEYEDPVIYITENGFSDRNAKGPSNDLHRIKYLDAYLNELQEAVVKDHVNVKVYTAWSLLDNFEWKAGFTEKFGVFWVDFNDPNRTRKPKASACYLEYRFKHNRMHIEGRNVPALNDYCKGSNGSSTGNGNYKLLNLALAIFVIISSSSFLL